MFGRHAKAMTIVLLASGCTAHGVPAPEMPGHNNHISGAPPLVWTYYSGLQLTPELEVLPHCGTNILDVCLASREGVPIQVNLLPGQKGDQVTLYGTGPMGEPRMTTGIVWDDWTWTDDPDGTRHWGMAIKAESAGHGFSGGPVYRHGRVIGVITRLAEDANGNEYVFAYRISDVLDLFAAELKR